MKDVAYYRHIYAGFGYEQASREYAFHLKRGVDGKRTYREFVNLLTALVEIMEQAMIDREAMRTFPMKPTTKVDAETAPSVSRNMASLHDPSKAVDRIRVKELEAELAHVKAKNERMFKAIRELEWSAKRLGMGYGIGPRPSHVIARACPFCQGVEPGDWAKREFPERVIGHRDGCFLAEALS